MVRELLDDLVRDVPDYSDPDRALAAARASRRRRTGGGAAFVAAAIALVAAVTWAPVAGPEPNLLARPHGSVRILPSTPADLPDGAVGPARLAYRSNCRLPCTRDVLRMAGGGVEYSLDRLGDLGLPTLSPNGELLVAVFGTGAYKVRDLRGDEPPQTIEPRLELGAWNSVTWSPDDRWLLMWRPSRTGTSSYARVDLHTRTAVTYTPPAGLSASAVLLSGELLLAPSTAWAARQPVQAADPATGAVRPLFTVDTSASSQLGQSIWHDPTGPALVSADGRLGLVVRGTDRRPVGLLEYDLASGAVIDVLDLPADAGWEPVAYTAGGIRVVNRNPVRAGIYDPVRRSVTASELPAAMQVLVPGGRTWYGP